MYGRALGMSLIVLCCLPVAKADKLQVATRGKKQTVVPSYGNLSSFDGTTLVFEEVTAKFGDKPSVQQLIAPVSVMRNAITVKGSQIVITLGARNSQEIVDTNHFEQAVPSPTQDVDLQHYEAQQKATRTVQPEAVEFDLTSCSTASIDQIVESDPQAYGKTKPPVFGKVQSIADGTVMLQRKSDGMILKHRLDALTEIRLGVCQ